jgi:hypothetical protein
MVRRGSPVRVRKRALQKPRRTRLSVFGSACRFANVGQVWSPLWSHSNDDFRKFLHAGAFWLGVCVKSARRAVAGSSLARPSHQPRRSPLGAARALRRHWCRRSGTGSCKTSRIYSNVRRSSRHCFFASTICSGVLQAAPRRCARCRCVCGAFRLSGCTRAGLARFRTACARRSSSSRTREDEGCPWVLCVMRRSSRWWPM